MSEDRQDAASQPDRSLGAGLYELLVQHSPYCIHEIDLGGQLTAMNPAGLTMMGVGSEDEIRGMEYLAAVCEDDRKRVDELLQRAIGGQSSEFEFEAANGRHFLSTFVPMHSEAGDVLSLMGITQDITQRVAAEEALRRSEERLQLALSAADIGVWELEAGGGRLRLSPRVYSACGLDPVAFRGTLEDYVAIVRADDRAAFEATLAASRQVGRRLHHQHRIVRPTDGSVRWLQLIGRSFEGGPAGALRVLGTVLDVTERVEEEQRTAHAQKMEQLGVLAGGIAHDFNNLLLGIMGNADLARAGVEPGSPGVRQLDAVLRGADRAADLCREMLAYAGQGPFVVEPVNLVDTVGEIIEVLSSAALRGVSLETRFADGPHTVLADRAQLIQVVMNLLTNAADAVRGRQGTVTVQCGTIERDSAVRSPLQRGPIVEAGTYLYLDVADDGPGMTSETQSKMFDPFFTSKRAGTGLGLAAVLGIVGRHDGGIEVDSAPSEGTRIRVLLPRCELDVVTSVERAPARRLPADRGTVLVVDDEGIVRRVVADTLEGANCEVLLAASGPEAIQIMKDRGSTVNVAVVDLSMPEMDGVRTIAGLRAVRSDLPVVLTSGFAEANAIAGLDRPVDAFLQKPYRTSGLIDTLAPWLEG